MASEGRIQSKGKRSKRPIGEGDFSLGGQTFTRTKGKIPRPFKRGYTNPPKGITFPIEVAVSAVA